MKIYVASSWRNERQNAVVTRLRNVGYDVYDFKNSKEGDNGFHWSEIDVDWKQWKTFEFVTALQNPIAENGFTSDFHNMMDADIGVLLLPCGKSAHLEAGYFIGAKKPLIILIEEESTEPELMYKTANKICTTVTEVIEFIERLPQPNA